MKKIKSLLVLIIAITILWGCESNEKTIRRFQNTEIPVVTIEGCEYFVIYQGAYAGYLFTHKGNCKNPIHYYSRDTIK